MNNVMLNARGVRQITRNDTMNIVLPQSTESYTVVSNQEIIETALESLYKEGFHLKNEFHKCDGSGSKFVGGFIVSGGDSTMDLMFGYKNSYDKSMSAAYALGTSILVCSNSSVRGDEMIMRKHTGTANKDIIKSISEGVKRLSDNYQLIHKDFTRLKEIEVTKRTIAELIGDMYVNESLITSHQLSVLKEEVFNESYNYGISGTAFNFYQDVTHSLKTTHPTKYLSNHADFHRYMEKEFELLS